MTESQIEDQFAGSLIGLALGDALGARHEGGPIGQAAWWLLGVGSGDLLRWTDDTQMAMGLAESLIENRALDPDHLARRWAEKCEWKRGYGPGARRLLQMIRDGADWREANHAIFPDGSFGNGAAMRAAPLGLFYRRNPEELARAAELAGSITHAHPLGIEGGVLIARATALAVNDAFRIETLHDAAVHEEFKERLGLAQREMTSDEVRRKLGVGIEAHRSAVTAVYAFSRFPSDFSGMMKFIVDLGGDTDTIGAMAGGIFGAQNGVSALPAELLERLEAREEIERLGRELWAAASS